MPDETCGNSGACGTGSPFVGYQIAPTLEECREGCDSNRNCGYFTHDSDNQMCLMYAECENFSEDNCPGCSTGSYDCELHQCYKTGFCFGDQVGDFQLFEDVNECVHYCHQTEGCVWWSYDSNSNGLCILTSDCQSKHSLNYNVSVFSTIY